MFYWVTVHLRDTIVFASFTITLVLSVIACPMLHRMVDHCLSNHSPVQPQWEVHVTYAYISEFSVINAL